MTDRRRGLVQPIDMREFVAKGDGKSMKGFADKRSKDEIGAVVEYIHALNKQFLRR